MNDNLVYRPDEKVAFREIGGAVVLVHTVRNSLLKLNEVGSAVWKRLDGRNVDSIAKDLSGEFQVSVGQASGDTIHFLETLRERGLVVLESGDIP